MTSTRLMTNDPLRGLGLRGPEPCMRQHQLVAIEKLVKLKVAGALFVETISTP